MIRNDDVFTVSNMHTHFDASTTDGFHTEFCIKAIAHIGHLPFLPQCLRFYNLGLMLFKLSAIDFLMWESIKGVDRLCCILVELRHEKSQVRSLVG